jgi:hypothetical protein
MKGVARAKLSMAIFSDGELFFPSRKDDRD